MSDEDVSRRPADVRLLGDPDRAGRSILLLRETAIVRAIPVPHATLLRLEFPQRTSLRPNRALRTGRKDSARLPNPLPADRPLPDRVALALDRAIGGSAQHVKDALLGWADAVGATTEDPPPTIVLDRDPKSPRRVLRLLLRTGDKTLAAEATPPALQDRPAGLSILGTPAPATAHEALARRGTLTRLQEPAP